MRLSEVGCRATGGIETSLHENFVFVAGMLTLASFS